MIDLKTYNYKKKKLKFKETRNGVSWQKNGILRTILFDLYAVWES